MIGAQGTRHDHPTGEALSVELNTKDCTVLTSTIQFPFLPGHALWLQDLRTELAAFPQARHGDQIDSISQFLGWFFERRSRRRQLVKIAGIGGWLDPGSSR